jgi:hypothetical protein
MMRYLLPGAAVALCLGLTLRTADTPEAKKAPAPTAVALLRLAQDKDDRTDYRTFRNTQAVLIKARRVLKGALAKPGITDLALVKAANDPVAWLDENLRVDFPLDGEVLRVALNTGKPSEAARLVNAVVEVYMEEFVARNQSRMRDRLEILDRIHTKYEDILRAKRNALRELLETLGTGDASVIATRQSLELKRLNAIQMELIGVQSQVRKVQLELSVQESKEKKPQEPQPASAVEEQVEKDLRVQELKKQIDTIEAALSRIREATPDVNKEPTFARMERQLEDVRAALKIRRKEVSAAVAKEMEDKIQAEAKARAAELRERQDMLKKLEELLKAEVDQVEKAIAQQGRRNHNLQDLREEMGFTQDMLKKLGAERESMRVEMGSPSRIAVIEKADVPVKD